MQQHRGETLNNKLNLRDFQLIAKLTFVAHRVEKQNGHYFRDRAT